MFGLQPTDIYSPCHTYGCHNRSTHFLGHADSPNGTVFYVCEQCGGELKESIIAEHAANVVEVEPLPFEDDPITFEEMTVSELKAFCKESGVTGYSDKNKPELIELLRTWDETV